MIFGLNAHDSHKTEENSLVAKEEGLVRHTLTEELLALNETKALELKEQKMRDYRNTLVLQQMRRAFPFVRVSDHIEKLTQKEFDAYFSGALRWYKRKIGFASLKTLLSLGVISGGAAMWAFVPWREPNGFEVTMAFGGVAITMVGMLCTGFSISTICGWVRHLKRGTLPE